MKKIKALSTFIATVVFMSLIFMTQAAFANDQYNPEKIDLNQEKTYTYTKDWDSAVFDDEHYYAFTTESSGYYELRVKGTDAANAVVIFVYDADGNEVDCDGVPSNIYDEIKVFNLKADMKYIIEVYAFESGSFTLTVSTHEHFDSSPSILKAYCSNYGNHAGEIFSYCDGCYCDLSQKIKKVSYVTLSKKSYKYNGKARKPTVTVKLSDGTKLNSKYYSVIYPKKPVRAGKYTVKVKFKGLYEGSITRNYTIKR